MSFYKKTLIASAVILIATPFVASAQNGDDTHHQIEQIIVTASPLSRTVEEIAQPTSVLGGDELRKKVSSSIGETLSTEPGVNATSFGPIASRPVIRGQGGERIGILINGLDSLDASSISDDHQVTSEGLLAESIEIIRGPATLLYGSGAAGGLINIVDNRLISEPTEELFSGRASLGTESANGGREMAIQSTLGSGNTAFTFDYFRRSTENIKIPGFAESEILMAAEEAEAGDDGDHGDEEEAFGEVENTQSLTRGGSVGISYFGDRGFVSTSFSGFDSVYGIPGHHHHHEEDHDDDEHDDDEHDDDDGDHGDEHDEEEESVVLDLKQKKIDIRAEYNLDTKLLDTIKFKVADSNYSHTEYDGTAIGTVFDVDGIDTRIEVTHNPWGNLEGAFGFQYRDVHFDVSGDEAYIPQTNTKRLSAFAFEEYNFNDDFTLQGSLRLEKQTIDGPTITQIYDNSGFSGSVGFIWNPEGNISLSSNLALTDRHPTAADLYADGPHIASARYERGGISLGKGIFKVEESTNIDITLRGDYDLVEWSITGFTNRVEDFLLLRPQDLEIDELKVYDYDQADVNFYGIEAEALFEIWDGDNGHLHLNLFTDFVNAEERNSGAYLPKVPPSRYGLKIHGRLNQLDVNLDAIFADSQSKLATNELATEGYTLVNLSLSYTLDNPDILLILRGSNLLDEEIRRHTSYLKDLVPLPGRSIYAGLTYNF